MNRRTFVKSLCAVPFCARAFADDSVPGSTIEMPSHRFGTASPEFLDVDPGVTDRVVGYLQSQIDAKVIPGASVCAMRNGKVFLEKALGTYCDRGTPDLPYDGAAVHPFFSVSKMISATAIVMAWQDGLIDLDDRVTKYIPEFGQGGKEAITIRQLVTHSAGIPKTPKGIKLDTEANWDHALDVVCRMPIQWPAGSQTLYHALTGLFIPAEIIRRAEGRKSWNQICEERIFKPLRLSTFTFDGPDLGFPYAIIPEPSGSETWEQIANAHDGIPSGGLKGSIADLLQFLKFQTDQGVWKKHRLLRKPYWTEMHTLQFPGKPAPHRDASGNVVPGWVNWGLGMMIKGTNPKPGGLDWFGIQGPFKKPHPRLFSHVGISTVMAVGDPDTDTQLVFISTDVPKPEKKKGTELRNTVSEIVFDAVNASTA